MPLQNKIQITELPITDEFRSQKRLIQERGELALIEDGQQFQHLGYFSLLASKGYRGGHYHNHKVEHFYIISGQLFVDLVDVETHEKNQVELQSGTKAIIYPGLAHRFHAIQDSQVIEYYNNVYNSYDDMPFDFNGYFA